MDERDRCAGCRKARWDCECESLQARLEQAEQRIRDADAFLADPTGNPLDAINFARAALAVPEPTEPPLTSKDCAKEPPVTSPEDAGGAARSRTSFHDPAGAGSHAEGEALAQPAHTASAEKLSACTRCGGRGGDCARCKGGGVEVVPEPTGPPPPNGHTCSACGADLTPTPEQILALHRWGNPLRRQPCLETESGLHVVEPPPEEQQP